MNIDTKILNKTWTEFHSISKGLYIVAKWNIVLEYKDGLKRIKGEKITLSSQLTEKNLVTQFMIKHSTD